MREFLRVAAPQAPVLVAYSWGDAAPLTRALIGAARTLHGLLRGRAPAPVAVPEAPPAEPTLYFHAHAPAWFQALGRPLRIASWKALGAEVLRTYMRGPYRPRCPSPPPRSPLLPGLMGRIAQQPLLVLGGE